MLIINVLLVNYISESFVLWLVLFNHIRHGDEQNISVSCESGVMFARSHFMIFSALQCEILCLYLYYASPRVFTRAHVCPPLFHELSFHFSIDDIRLLLLLTKTQTITNISVN